MRLVFTCWHGPKWFLIFVPGFQRGDRSIELDRTGTGSWASVHPGCGSRGRIAPGKRHRASRYAGVMLPGGRSMTARESDSRTNPILKFLAVDSATHVPIRPAEFVVTFARAAKDGRPREPLEEGWDAPVAIDRDGFEEVTVNDDGVVAIELGIMDRRRGPAYSMPPPHWTEGWPARVRVLAPAYFSAESDWIQVPMGVEDDPHQIELSLAPIVGGRVLDKNEAPIAGVDVELVRRTEEKEKACVRACFGVPYRDDHDVVTRTKTDVTGGFILPYTEDGTFSIRARAPGRSPVVTAPMAVPLATPPAPRELVLTVLDTGVEGSVKDFDGVPTAGIPVVSCRADGFAQYATADAAGRYRLLLPPGRYRVNRGDPTAPTWRQLSIGTYFDPEGVHADVPAVDPMQFMVEVPPRGFAVWDLDARRPHDASLIVHVDAEWEDPASLPVRLSRFVDDSVANLTWPRVADLAWPRRAEFYFEGDAPALFPELPPGRYQVQVGGDDVEIELFAAECTEIVVELTTATVDGRLLDADGAGVVARLELDEPPPVNDGKRWVWTRSESTQDTTSDADGSFHFYLVRPGKCRLRVYLDRGGTTKALVYDAPLSLLTKGLHEPIIRLGRAALEE